MARVISDSVGISYHDETLESPRNRGNPVIYNSVPSSTMSALPWNATIIEATSKSVAANVFKIYMAYQEGDEDEVLRFRTPSPSCRYIEGSGGLAHGQRSNVQHVLLPKSAGKPGDAITTVQITTSGDATQYEEGRPYDKLVPPFSLVRTLELIDAIPWCVSLNFELIMMDEVKNSDLCWELQLSPTHDIVPYEWMDSIQIRIMHGSAQRYLCVALRVTENRSHEIDSTKLVEPLLFQIDSLRLRLKAQAGKFKLPLEYIDEEDVDFDEELDLDETMDLYESMNIYGELEIDEGDFTFGTS
ncbi:hypothetical protein PT974_09081 [Cladobotryum mycophilum]|uniref:Uncharacterized protein n=1 Tax=Cladobotryum mycophilum TaxID=491253 RepID=A0ABR0SF70_9HYPO